MEIMFRRYFEEGADLSKSEELLLCIEEVGLSVEDARKVLSEGTGGREVTVKARTWSSKGVSGVPFFAFSKPGEELSGMSGAQPAETLAEVREEIAV
jgi:predicted DsbA family dithiol-disulfide isomerase